MNKSNDTFKSSKLNQKENKDPVALSFSQVNAIEDCDLDMGEEMSNLYCAIDSMLPDTDRKVIQFIGSNEGEGTSTIVREFAKVLAEKFGKSVRLLDMEMQKTGRLLCFDFKLGNMQKDNYQEEKPNDNTENQGPERLFVKSYSIPFTYSTQIADFMGTSDMENNIRQKIDFILVDSLPATASSNGLAFTRKMDGVVLVIEAEKTRWKVVESVKNKIINHGGKILGVVLNKRRHHIPEFIYKNL